MFIYNIITEILAFTKETVYLHLKRAIDRVFFHQTQHTTFAVASNIFYTLLTKRVT